MLHQITMTLAFAAVAVFFCHYARIPTVVAFILTGLAIGPRGLGLIHNVHEVEELAEIGVVLLLFTIGLEFSFARLFSVKRLALLGGGGQVALTTLAFMPGGVLLLGNFKSAFFFGFLLALSSTAIVLRLISDKGEMESPHGKTALGILIFQDIAVVPMMLFMPMLSSAQTGISPDAILLLAKGAAILILVMASALWIVPMLLDRVAATRNRELFQLTIIVLCFSVAWLTYKAGLSLALGAFMAGLVISESEYSHQAMANAIPFRDVFASFFFISVGMLLDTGFVWSHAGLVLALTLAVMAVKIGATYCVGYLMGFSFRTAIVTALFLCQVGEFSFVLYRAAMSHDILKGDAYQYFLAVSVLTMLAAPFIIAGSSRIAAVASRLPMTKRMRYGLHHAREQKDAEAFSRLAGHLVIIGFGFTGKQLARAARTWQIPYVIIEYNPVTVREEKEKGEPIFFGDATQEAILAHASLAAARVVAVAIPDPVCVRRVTKLARQMNPGIHIVTRTRFLSDYKELRALGADDVIPEEYETSIEVFSLVLSRYAVPRHEIEEFVDQVRADGYEMFRRLPESAASLCEYTLPNAEIVRFTVKQGARAEGRTLGELALRKDHGVTVLSIRKAGSVVSSPGADTLLLAGDVLLAVGEKKLLADAACLFAKPA